MIQKKALATYKYIPKTTDHVWKRLPRVPMTQYLETPELNTDIMYNGYRPLIYPVKENPLFRHKKNQKSIMKNFIDSSTTTTHSNNSSKDRNLTDINTYLYGKKNQGGIKTLGVNGTWKYGPKVPSNLLPFNWWSVSSLGMECYPEWNGVPREVIAKLKPFDRG
ncbi:protein Sue1p, mitochondrial [Monosporozyma unispora]|nr:hypothetical protein C6P44_002979 [Kazachstania unispora]